MDVLIVDDDPVLRRLLRAQLSRLGYTVREVANGELAWNLLQQEHIPIVVTDWMMPALDGPGLIARIRAAALPRYSYLILLTAKDSRADVVAGLDAGADDYLTKPCDASELRARIAIGARIVDLESQLREARDTDSLTSLRNRRAIVAAAEIELERARREARPLSVALLDVDHFKQVNDRYGHQTGDQALRLIAATIVQHVRVYDAVGRWGGEEVLIVLPGTNLAEAAAVAERVRHAIVVTMLTLEDGQPLPLTVSMGVASAHTASGLTLDSLVQHADMALYQAKLDGRNRVCQMALD